MGDPAGIGGELALKAWLARRDTGPVFVALDGPDRLRAIARTLGLPVPIADSADPAGFAEALPVYPVSLAAPAMPGRPDPANAPAVIRSIETAARMTLAGQARALVTDGRMSGASGVVLAAIHLTPDAVGGGPIAKLRDGDLIRLDSRSGVLEARVNAEEWTRRENATADLSANAFGMGRELFGLFRAHAAPAEQGGGVCY